MRSLLDDIIDNHGPARVVGEQHDTGKINWVAGLSDPGEMIGCGMYQQLRRHNGEEDGAYQERLTRELALLPDDVRNKIESFARDAALNRASLDTTNGRVSMMSAGLLPWHGLGVQVDKATTSAQAIELAGLDWEVLKTPLAYEFQGQVKPATDVFGIVRQDNGRMLGAVGTKYKPIQNREGFAFLDGVLDEYGARYETAGSLYGGRQVWMLAHMPKQTFKVNGDTVEPYVLFSNPHDGSGSAWCYPTSVRVVCANTFRIAGQGQGKGLSIRHTGSVKQKMSAAREALGLAVEGFTDFKEHAEVMYRKPLEINHYASDVLDAVLEVTAAQAMQGADALAAALCVTQAAQDLAAKSFERKIEKRGEILDDILDRYERRQCETAVRGTAWAAFNAVTEHADHSKPGRQSSDEETRLGRRFESTINGDADRMKQAAYALATR